MAKISSEMDIAMVVRGDDEMMKALRVARDFNLPDWWIGAGFLRNKVWDVMEGVYNANATDVDLVYFNTSDVKPETDWGYDEQLHLLDPHNNWEVRNQARMHYINGLVPFTSTKDGISHWTETATAIGVKLIGEELSFLFCYGTDDLLNLVARPTPYLKGDLAKVFHDRMKKKNWKERWVHLQIEKE